MEAMEVEVIRVELKYCEACGALRLRAPGNRSAYCRECDKLMSELAHAPLRGNEGRRP